jgi:transcriptional regulator with PAS, ATPase and Fis domain
MILIIDFTYQLLTIFEGPNKPDMAKILISWMALEYDFEKDKGSVNPDGPNSTVHKLFYHYEYHLLLTSSKSTMEDIKYQHLATFLKNTYKHKVEEKALGISDVINLEEICGKIYPLLLSLKNNDIDIFISPGTPTMQVAWYLANESLGIKTNLFQLRRAKHTVTKKPEQVWVKMEKSSYTASLIIKQEKLDSSVKAGKNLIVDSLKAAYKKAEKIAATDQVRVLITGETGTGKENLAEYIHANSPRRNARFERINCSAFGNDLLESRLFGYVKGAFTGATETTDGLFQELDGGTVLLDEIGDITPYMQQTLLRVIESGEILRVGSRKTETVNVRVLAATNKNLLDLCKENKFRYDLYYRLAVAEIKIPSLRDYGYKEKEQMFDYLWKQSKKEFNKREPKLKTTLKKRILEYAFPGNIREMENIIDGIMAEADEEVKAEYLPERITMPNSESSMKLIDIENAHIRKVLQVFPDNRQQVCKVLGISVNTLKDRISKYQLDEGQFSGFKLNR